jgi:hypothetical protein
MLFLALLVTAFSSGRGSPITKWPWIFSYSYLPHKHSNCITSSRLYCITKRNHYKDYPGWSTNREVYKEADKNMSAVVRTLEKTLNMSVIKIDISQFKNRNIILSRLKHTEHGKQQFPYFYNTGTNRYIRGYSSLLNLRRLALGLPHEHVDSAVYCRPKERSLAKIAKHNAVYIANIVPDKLLSDYYSMANSIRSILNHYSTLKLPGLGGEILDSSRNILRRLLSTMALFNRK